MIFDISKEKRRQFEIDGYFLLESVIPPEHIELLRNYCRIEMDEMDAEMDRQGKDLIGINHRGKRYFCGLTMEKHPQLKSFIFSDLMASIGIATLGENVFVHGDQFVVKNSKEGMKFSWHQDGAYVYNRIGDHPECITCWCPLDDVDEENGTAYLLPFSRFGERELVEHIKDEKTNDRIGYFGDDPGDPIIAPAGSIAVFSSLSFHRSGANPTGNMRRVYLAQYAPVPIKNIPGAFPRYYGEPFIKNGEPVPSTIGGNDKSSLC